MEPIISIIIATFNSEATIATTLDSILCQSLQSWECVVVDGLSRDGTCSILADYVRRDSRIRYISETDNGIYDALNKGVKLSNGEWIYVLGSDDSLVKDGLFSLVNEITPEFEAISGYVFVQRQGRIVGIRKSKGWAGSHQAKIIRKRSIQEVGYFDLSFPIMADTNMMFALEQKGCHIKNIDKAVACFSVNGESSKFRNQISIFKERYRIRRTYNVSFALFVSLWLSAKAVFGYIFHKIWPR